MAHNLKNVRASGRLSHLLGRVYATQVKDIVPSGLRSHVFLMRVTGVWPTAIDSPSYKWQTVAFFFFIGVAFPCSQFANIFFTTTIEEAMDFSFTSLSVWTSAFKTAVIYWRRDNIRQLFGIHGQLSYGSGRIADTNRRVARLNTLVHVILTLFYLLVVGAAVAQTIFSRPEDAIIPSTSRLPYHFAARRDVYWSVLMAQVICASGVIIWTAIDDSFFIALINIALGHLGELKMRFEGLGSEFERGERNCDARFGGDLVECCRRYENCLRLIAVMNRILSVAFFVQFGVSALVLCSTVYLLSVNNPMDNFIKFVSVMIYFAAVINQLLLNCYFGSRLTQESNEITHAIYSSQWMDRSEKCKRGIRILMERSRRPMAIRAGGLFDLSLPTFVQICRAAFSYFNLLREIDTRLSEGQT